MSFGPRGRKKRQDDASSPQRQMLPRGHRVRAVLACVALFVVLAVCPVFVNNVIGYLPVVAFIVFVTLSFAYLRALKRSLRFEQVERQMGCVRGESLPFKLSVRNSSLLPAVRVETLFVVRGLGHQGAQATVRPITLPPRSTKTFDFAVRFDHIGTYTVGIEQVVVHDPFGIFSAVLVNDLVQQVNVGPRLVNVAKLEVSDDTVQESKRMLRTVINDGFDYAGVREYVWGDPIKTIHWKLSARELDTYYTRLYETVSNPGIAVFMDFESLNYGEEELMSIYDTVVESAFSIEHFGSACGMDTELLFVDENGEKERITGPVTGFDAVLAKTPRVVSGSGASMLDFLRTEAASIYAQSNLVVCTSCITDELVRTLLSVRSGKRTPLLFAVLPPGLERDTRDELLRPLKHLGGSGVFYLVITSSQDLERE